MARTANAPVSCVTFRKFQSGVKLVRSDAGRPARHTLLSPSDQDSEGLVTP